MISGSSNAKKKLGSMSCRATAPRLVPTKLSGAVDIQHTNVRWGVLWEHNAITTRMQYEMGRFEQFGPFSYAMCSKGKKGAQGGMLPPKMQCQVL